MKVKNIRHRQGFEPSGVGSGFQLVVVGRNVLPFAHIHPKFSHQLHWTVRNLLAFFLDSFRSISIEKSSEVRFDACVKRKWYLSRQLFSKRCRDTWHASGGSIRPSHSA